MEPSDLRSCIAERLHVFTCELLVARTRCSEAIEFSRIVEFCYCISEAVRNPVHIRQLNPRAHHMYLDCRLFDRSAWSRASEDTRVGYSCPGLEWR